MAHGENSITMLPMKFAIFFTPFMHPDRGNPLQFFHPVGNRVRPRKSRQKMNVILDSADTERRTLQGLGHPAKVLVQSLTERCVTQEWGAVFRGEDQMQVDSSQRLWHVNPFYVMA
jgi:hypothetical protein